MREFEQGSLALGFILLVTGALLDVFYPRLTRHGLVLSIGAGLIVLAILGVIFSGVLP